MREGECLCGSVLAERWRSAPADRTEKLSGGSVPTHTHTRGSAWLHTDGENDVPVCLSAPSAFHDNNLTGGMCVSSPRVPPSLRRGHAGFV